VTLIIRNRYTACLLHFLISLFVFSTFVLILLNFWYPQPFFTASGGLQGLKLVAAIDLVLGPALTLIVYNINKSKKELFTDFSIIAFIQITALCWGVFTVYNQRPVAAVFWENGFYTVPASALENRGISLKKLDKYGSKKPVYIFAAQPQSDKDREQMINAILEEHIPPYQQLDRFKPVEQHYNDIYKHSVDILKIISKNSDMKDEIDAVLTKSGTSLNDNHYITLISKYRNIILIFNQNNQIIGTASAPFKNKN